MTDFIFHSGPHQDVLVSNPGGSIALCTQWHLPEDFFGEYLYRPSEKPSGTEFLWEHLAVIGTLRGPGGLPAMLRNLHHNPQITKLIVWGPRVEAFPAGEILEAYFRGKVLSGPRHLYREPGRNRPVSYATIVWPDLPVVMVDGALPPTWFCDMPRPTDSDEPCQEVCALQVVVVGEDEEALAHELLTPIPAPWSSEEVAAIAVQSRRERTPSIPRPWLQRRPSVERGFLVRGDGVQSVWEDLVNRVRRFGRERSFGGKQRLELRNVTAVIAAPGECSEGEQSCAREYGKYMWQEDFYACEYTADYTYGDRLARGNIQRLAENFREDPRDLRRGWISLWDNDRDAAWAAQSAPCLTSVYFRPDGDRMHLDVTFRSHNLSRAWKLNCLGLFALLGQFCRAASGPYYVFTPGVLTIHSHSLTLDILDLPVLASTVPPPMQRGMFPDPHGNLRVYRDGEKICVDHLDLDGSLLHTYTFENCTAMDIFQCLTDSMVVSDLGHAMWLGAEVTRILGSGK